MLWLNPRILSTIPIANMKTSKNAVPKATPPRAAVPIFMRLLSDSVWDLLISANPLTRFPVRSPTEITSMSSLSRRLNLCKAAEIGAPSFTAVLNDWKRERIWAFFRDFSDNLNVSVVFTPDAKRVEARFENLQISECSAFICYNISFFNLFW